jgi:hypothetical protein
LSFVTHQGTAIAPDRPSEKGEEELNERMSALRAVAAFLVVTASSLTARAEPIEALVPRLIEQGGWLRAHYPGQVGANGQVSPDRLPTLFHHDPPADPTDLLGTELHTAVVARDWQEAFNLTDGRSLLFDRIRMIRSSRMAVARFTLAGGRFLPYAEASFGQWRPDTDIVPWLRAELETASQLTLGVQVHLAPRCAFAWDVEQTQIFFASAAQVPVTRVTASFAALRAEF